MLCSCKHTSCVYSGCSVCALRPDEDHPSGALQQSPPLLRQQQRSDSLSISPLRYQPPQAAVSPSGVGVILLCVPLGDRCVIQGLAPAPSSSDCQSGLFSDQPFLSFTLPFIRSLLCCFPDTPFLSGGSWLLLMLLRENLPPDSCKSLVLGLLVQD